MERDESTLVKPASPGRARKVTPAASSQDDPALIVFPQGLIGCPDWQRFRLLPDPFERYGELVCLDVPGIFLIVADPLWLPVNCSFELDDTDTDALQLTTADDARVLVILTIARDVPAVFANLAGPLVINWRTRVARQVVLDHNAFPLRTPVLTGSAARSVVAALDGEEDSEQAQGHEPHHTSAAKQLKGA